jgi:hypothetical protein
MDAGDVMVRLRLRRAGIVVNHVAAMPAGARAQTFVVFLEGTLGQHGAAAETARRLPGVVRVGFSRRSRSIMYVTLARVPRPGAPPPL